VLALEKGDRQSTLKKKKVRTAITQAGMPAEIKSQLVDLWFQGAPKKNKKKKRGNRGPEKLCTSGQKKGRRRLTGKFSGGGGCEVREPIREKWF